MITIQFYICSYQGKVILQSTGYFFYIEDNSFKSYFCAAEHIDLK